MQQINASHSHAFAESPHVNFKILILCPLCAASFFLFRSFSVKKKKRMDPPAMLYSQLKVRDFSQIMCFWNMNFRGSRSKSIFSLCVFRLTCFRFKMDYIIKSFLRQLLKKCYYFSFLKKKVFPNMHFDGLCFYESVNRLPTRSFCQPVLM